MWVCGWGGGVYLGAPVGVGGGVVFGFGCAGAWVVGLLADPCDGYGV